MGLSLVPKQKQMLSAHLIQSTQILQMNTVQLESYINQLAMENPVIDVESHQNEYADQSIQRVTCDLPYQVSDTNYYCSKYNEDENERTEWNFNCNGEETLEEYLLFQMISLPFSEDELFVVEFMIYNLDEKGYMTENLDELSSKFSISIERAEHILSMLQTLEPAGIFARNLEECLLIQLKRKNKLDEDLEKIIKNYLDYLARCNYREIARRLKQPISIVAEKCEIIKSLEPKPGSSFYSGEKTICPKPDVYVIKEEEGLRIEINSGNCPQITKNQYYLSLLKNSELDEETKRYLNVKSTQASWITSCIEQRNQTLYNVSKAIVNFQKKFFMDPTESCIPLKMTDVAEILDIHESTVCRAVHDKYIQCSRGLYPMSNFFVRNVYKHKSEMNEMSPEEIKKAIVEIIEEENEKKPYSDRIIADLLDKKNFKVSRRTVAKYRMELGIKDACGRRAII